MTHPNPIAFTIGNIDVRWYGVLMSLGICLGILIACKRAPQHGLKDDDVIDVCLWMIPVGAIGARLYYVLFNLNNYHSLAEALNFRAGGLAIHGALLFGAAALIGVCRHKKISILNMLDLLMPCVVLGQAIGRWGNFFNGEAHGGPTNLPWAIIVDGVKVHPTFLYESIWCLLLFIFLSWMHKNKHEFYGQITALYGILYSVERFLVEALRTDSLMIGPFKQAQVLSLGVIIVCVLLYNYCKKHCQINAE